jgi:Ca-activated chloride channel family protein
MPSARRLLPAAAALLTLAAPMVVVAQQPTFKTGTQVVSLFVTVADAQKRLVPDLTQDDFEVFDNDKPQAITYFDNSLRPITVVVMLDTSGSMTLSIELLKKAAEQFLLRLMPDDRAKVGAFNDKLQISAEFTNNRDQLISAAKDLDFGNGTRLWDAVDMSLDELKNIDGRRVILVFTDGDDTDSKKANLGGVIERARAEEVMIYAIGLESSYFNGQRMTKTKPDRGLRKIADETGGGYFELEKSADLEPTFTRVAQELHSQYVIGFAPTLLDGRVHKLAVRMKQPGLSARARKSYVAVAERSTK